jgi:hypothetical protein
VSSDVRASRDNLYAAILHSFPSLLSTPPGTPFLVTIVHGTPLPELPVERAQVVLVGDVVNITPRLITGTKGLYSEYSIAVVSILMNHSKWQQGGTLDLVELGGYAQMPDGRVLGHLTPGLGNQIEAGRKYLLFLNYNATAQCFTFVKPWELNNDRVLAVSSDDLVRVTKHSSTVNGLPVELVVSRVRALVDALENQ